MAVTFNADAALAKLQALVETHGPEATGLALEATRVDGINELTGIPGFGLLTVLSFYACRYCIRKATGDDYDSDGFWLGLVPAGIALAGFGFGFVASLLNIWAWVAVFNPRLALAHQILERVTQ